MARPAEAIRAATLHAAELIGWEDRVGRLAPGYLADIILVDMSGPHCQPLHSITASLVYNTRAGDVQTVIVNGQVIMLDREILTLNKAEIISEVNKNMTRLAQCIPDKRIQIYNP